MISYPLFTVTSQGRLQQCKNTKHNSVNTVYSLGNLNFKLVLNIYLYILPMKIVPPVAVLVDILCLFYASILKYRN